MFKRQYPTGALRNDLQNTHRPNTLLSLIHLSKVGKPQNQLQNQKHLKIFMLQKKTGGGPDVIYYPRAGDSSKQTRAFFASFDFCELCFGNELELGKILEQRRACQPMFVTYFLFN